MKIDSGQYGTCYWSLPFAQIVAVMEKGGTTPRVSCQLLTRCKKPLYRNLNSSCWVFVGYLLTESTQECTRIKATRCEMLRTVKTNNLKKHSHLTYCLNVSLMVQKWMATIFSTSEPILLIVHENDLFWYVTANI